METIKLILEAAVVLGAIILGVRSGGVGIGLWGGVGAAILVFVFGEKLGAPPISALLIIVAVILATSTLQVCGGIDWMVSVAARAIVRWPSAVTYVAPLVTLLFSMGAGTSNILFSLMPVIQEVSKRAGVRPSKPLSLSIAATAVALACSPVSATMAVMTTIMDETDGGWSILKILSLSVPASVIGVLLTSAFVSRFGGKDLGEATDVHLDNLETVTRKSDWRAKASVLIYFAGVGLIIVFGLFPNLRPLDADGESVGVSTLIQLIMLATGAVITFVARPDLSKVPTVNIFRGGMVAAIAFFGLAWMIDTFLVAQTATVQAAMTSWVEQWPWTMAIGVFIVVMLTTSESTGTRMILPIALAAGVPVNIVVGLWVGALAGTYVLPTNGIQIAAAELDDTGSTKLGKRLYDHSFFVPSLVLTLTTCVAGGLLSPLYG